MTLMTIIDDTALHQSKKKSQKLEKLWQDVEKKQTRNQRYQAKLDDFYEEFKPLIESKEHVVCKATATWIRHLLTFVPRKTIKGNQRETLYHWIQEELTILEANPFNPISTTELREHFTSLLIDYQSSMPKLDVSVDELKALREDLFAMFGQYLPLSDEELIDMIHQPERFQAYMQDMMSQDIHSDSENEYEDDFEWDGPDWDMNDDFSFGNDESELPMDSSLFEDKAMTKLYRQLANQLHPDKEQDPEKKALKKDLKQLLSQAKKDKDALSLLMMAQEHLPEYKLTADDDMLKRIEGALHSKIALLNQEHQFMQHGNDIKSEIWRRFGGGSKASRAKTLEQYGALLIVESEALYAKINSLTTVQALRKQLSQRAHQRQLNDMMGFEMFEDFLD
ncbi:molecular chaperone DnaJ [Shewanella inventionis]|uniref:Molecular chaperone DnaJ n=1 Tax=Shewanella inventionis TaxID=1738770 RepID=A0ABQ1JT96_9GAMM|nr:molecular chaperone DnaJ [Shewanella inventionis]MCL1160098.1 molecular chaperone DnaJ [Shewanella inventionis]GGB77254.1 molecular chaperone DnaJ [Shewanella inventionis]